MSKLQFETLINQMCLFQNNNYIKQNTNELFLALLQKKQKGIKMADITSLINQNLFK